MYTIDKTLAKPVYTPATFREAGYSEADIQRIFGKQAKKSLTALILTVEPGEDGPVAVYGLPITDDKGNGHEHELDEEGKETQP